MANRPDVNKIINGLKDFQEKTVDYVFSRLYLNANPADRFLLADEVGLGKTLVARGVIAKAINYLWEDISRIDVIYICANSSIARQNINRLNITGEREFSFATRITLLPLEIDNLKGNKLNFVSFTPGTSFDLRSQGGIARERLLIYHILKEGWGFGDKAGPKNIFQCGVEKDNWRRRLKNFDKNIIDQELAAAFLKNLNKEPELKEQFIDLSDRFFHFRKYENLPDIDKEDRSYFIGQLRQKLAETCIGELEPDIVVMDEFQRFKYLLDGEDDTASLARLLFNYPDVKIMLLSATPYKMYTMYQEREVDDHYQDLLRTVEFLFDSQSKTESFKNDLKAYRRELFNLTNSTSNRLLQIKNRIEDKLGQIMVRNERINTSRDQNAMLTESENESLSLSPQEVRSFSLIDKVAEITGSSNPINYWKSAPYLLNFMDKGYKLKEKLITCLKDEETKAELKDILEREQKLLLSWDHIYNYRALEPDNAKLRSMINQTIENESWKLLWIPPSMPYYNVTDGPYSELELHKFTKSLIFSSWRIVPRVVSMLLSYEAERKMVKSYNENAKYTDLSGSQTQLLRFSVQEREPANMSSFNLFYPCLTLSRVVDPLQIGSEAEENKLNKKELFARTQSLIENLMDPVIDEYVSYEASNPDQKWYWAAPVLLDKLYNPEPIEDWFANKGEDLSWESMIETKGEDNDSSAFQDHIDQLRRCFTGDIELGKPPDDLIEVITKAAIGSPAVTALRSFRRLTKDNKGKGVIVSLLGFSAKTALNFRSLFNRPDAMHLIRSIHSIEESRYWESVLDYCINGNLQSVLDEYTHILRETNGLTDKESSYAVSQICEEMEKALTIRSATPQFDEIITEPDLEIKKGSIRCHYALRFGDSRDEEGEKTRAEQVRSGFNSPFRPFILATTSIGQEGLDFHLYSHRIYHWNLPSNPVDLEQREGRIHRYKGHAIRRNVACKYSILSLEDISQYQDPWDLIFELARQNRSPEFNDMVPFWIYDIEDGHKIYRHTPAFPLSKEVYKLKYLKKTMGAYRMVFGQPRQEDLVNYLSQHLDESINMDDVMDYKISLTPE